MIRNTFDPTTGTVTRETRAAESRRSDANTCGKDALAFLYFVRQELSQGRMPAPKPFFSARRTKCGWRSPEPRALRSATKPVEADRIDGVRKRAVVQH